MREKMVPTPVLDEVAELNKSFHAVLKGTVWENYMLLTTQWPSDPRARPIRNGAPAPTYLANTTLETYSQGTDPACVVELHGVPRQRGELPAEPIRQRS